jgi:gas vesicle protein
MAKVSKTITTLLLGAAAGAVIGYLLATDKDKRVEDLSKLKLKLTDLKENLKYKFETPLEDPEHEMYKS